jgi:hypothetical protein
MRVYPCNCQSSDPSNILTLYRQGLIDYDDEMKKLKLYSERGSKLGSQLSESTTRRVIVVVLLSLIIIPVLTYSPTNRSPDLSTEMLHHFNTNPDLSFEAKDAMLTQFLSEHKPCTSVSVRTCSISPMESPPLVHISMLYIHGIVPTLVI